MKYGVVLGRLSPIHKGHMILIDTMLESFGVSRSMIIIGSSNAKLSHRNMFSYSERRRFIKTLYPDIKVVGLGDHYGSMHGDDLKNWFTELDDILMASTGCEDPVIDVSFYSGNEEDISFFVQSGRNISYVDRFDPEESKVISGQEIRSHLMMNRRNRLSEAIDERILKDVQLTFALKFKILQSM